MFNLACRLGTGYFPFRFSDRNVHAQAPSATLPAATGIILTCLSLSRICLGRWNSRETYFSQQGKQYVSFADFSPPTTIPIRPWTTWSQVVQIHACAKPKFPPLKKGYLFDITTIQGKENFRLLATLCPGVGAP